MQPPQRFPAKLPSHIDPDDAIRLTDDDAASSRLSVSPPGPDDRLGEIERRLPHRRLHVHRAKSATSLGYLSDPFLPLLYKQPYNPANPVASSSRKPPLINVGTHHRTYGIDLLVDRFFEDCRMAGKAARVLSLGAGSDSRFWRLTSRSDPPDIHHYVEVDFPTATGTKAQRIARSTKLHPALARPSSTSSTSSPSRQPDKLDQEKPYTIQSGGTSLRSHHYSLLPIDLRRPNALAVLDDILDPALPLLILAECVLCYMQPEEADRIFEWAGRFKNRAVVVYEMVGLRDAFGSVMRRNLAARNLKLPGAVYDTPAAMAERFTRPELSAGRYENSGATTLWDIRKTVIPEEELQRISRLEHLDEIEELQLVLSHYCIAYATSGTILSNVKF